MANAIYSADFLTASAYLKSTENTTFVASNVGSVTYPFRPWKANALILNEWVGVDLGISRSVTAVVADNINFSLAKIQADTTATFNSVGGTDPAYDSGSQTVSQDPRDGRFKIFFAVTQTYRYWRIRCAASSTQDGADSASVGSLLCLDSHVTLNGTMGFPYSATVKKATMGEGTGEPISIGNLHVELSLASTKYPDTVYPTFQTEFYTLLRQGKSTPLVFYRNNANTSEVYIVHRVGDVTVSRPGASHMEFTQLRFREVGDLLAA